MTQPKQTNNDDTRYAPRNEHGGRYKRTCPICGKKFRTNNPRSKYNSLECRTWMRNQRYYKAHKHSIIERVVMVRRQKRTQPTE